MSIKKQAIRKAFLVQLVFLLQAFVSFAQDEITQDTINGVVYNVYPFPIEFETHSTYYIAQKRTRSDRFSMKEYIEVIYGDEKISYKEKRMIRREMRGEFSSRGDRKENKHLLNKKFKNAVRKNPYPLMEQRYSLEHDIIPSLDNIPDGKYVQYFDMVVLLDKKGRSNYVGNQIAGYFTIKNNMLEGEAIWFNVKGDTLKKGRFEKGLKVGEWSIETRKIGYTVDPINAKLYIERGYPNMDTIREIVNYAGGFKNGTYAKFENSIYPVEQGQYKDNIAVGEWLERDISFTGKGKKRVRNRNNNVITFRYTPTTEETVVRQPIIRNRLIKDLDYKSPFDFMGKYSVNVSFSRLYGINYPKDLDIELEEETINSYEGEVYEEEYYDDEYYGDEIYYEEEEYYGEGYGGNTDYANMVYDASIDDYVPLSKLVDSLGIYFKFDGIYEKRYPNGQLMMRYEFKNGNLVSEDTIFWDNGKPYDIITFDTDSNQYLHRVYDYKGKLYNEIVYDSVGDFKRVNFKPITVKYFMLDGLNVEDEKNARFFFYDKLDTLENDLSSIDSLVIFRSWFKVDTAMLYSRMYYPKDRTLKFSSYAITGKAPTTSELTFSEGFDSWTGIKKFDYGNLTMKTTSSASYSEWVEKDSIPQRQVNDYSRSYNTTDEYILMQDNKPFSGDLSITFNEKNMSLHSGKAIQMVFPRDYVMKDKLEKDFVKYKESGKTKYEDLFGCIDASDIESEFSDGIFSALFGGFISEFMLNSYSDYDYDYDYDYEGEGRPKRYKERKAATFTKQVEGHMIDGVPVGLWVFKDQKGNVIAEVPFDKGMVNGTVKEYDYAYPNDNNYDYYNYIEGPDFMIDSTPKRTKFYLSRTTDYKNGLTNGISYQYNWLGEITKLDSYKEGYKDGESFERNNLAYTTLTYKDGSLDGYVKTYLTLKGKDSTLLYDLNFQNGALQGESKAFHLNGKLAKKGFFLNGDPIDDYEAYDTLGFKYHYVKFQYSYPVEEKIWEENQLSVRYLFDWRDSIYFQPTDITTSQSLERTLAQLGIGNEYYRPYYGRPSLVSKTGIDYHITKYYPNDSIARDGVISTGKKVGCWKYWSYEGEMLYEVDYFDTIISINDSIQFKAKGIQTDYNAKGEKISESYVIEKFEKYDCSHTDHYEIRQLMTIWQGKDSVDRMNGYVKNYYDNGVLQNEGMMKNGVPTGVWKYYDPYGKLNQVGNYVLGKRDGRWLGGDLSKTKYLGDICLNPNLPDLEEEIKYREKLLDIVITNYKMGKALNKEFYDVNLNTYEEESEEEIIESDIEFR